MSQPPPHPDPSENQGWLGEVSEDDLRPAGAIVDVYAPDPDEPEETRILETHILASQGDPEIPRLLLFGLYLLLASAGIQMLRSSSLQWPAELAPFPATPAVQAPRSAPPKPKVATVSQAPPPRLESAQAQRAASGAVVILVALKNNTSTSTARASVSVVFTAKGESAEMRGTVPTLPAGQRIEIPVDTPFQASEDFSPQEGRFTTKEGHTIDFEVLIEGLP